MRVGLLPAGRGTYMAKRILVVALVALSLCSAETQPADTESVNIAITTGFSGLDLDRDFVQIEVAVIYRLEPFWVWANGWNLGFRPGAGIAVLRGHEQTGFLAVSRPALVLAERNDRISLHAASGPSLLYPQRYRNKDFGGPLQFVSRVGIRLKPGQRLTLGYYLQHMSNAGIYKFNPGLNLRCVEISWGF